MGTGVTTGIVLVVFGLIYGLLKAHSKKQQHIASNKLSDTAMELYATYYEREKNKSPNSNDTFYVQDASIELLLKLNPLLSKQMAVNIISQYRIAGGDAFIDILKEAGGDAFIDILKEAAAEGHIKLKEFDLSKVLNLTKDLQSDGILPHIVIANVIKDKFGKEEAAKYVLKYLNVTSANVR